MFFLVPCNENGIIIDPYAGVNLRTVSGAAEMSDCFIYSHGWWNSAVDAMISYNRFSAGLFAASPQQRQNLMGLGLHWPSMLSENQRDWLNLAEGVSFFTMETRAEHVGRHGVCDLLRFILQSRAQAGQHGPLRIHLLGHSFGCKVICAALAEMIETNSPSLYQSINFNLVLLQPAIEDDALSPSGRYGGLAAALPRSRIFITKSSADTALGVYFKRAHALELFDKEDRTALGAGGPSRAAIDAFGGAEQVVCGEAGFISMASKNFSERLFVADLSAIHHRRVADGEFSPRDFAGQHSDIYFPEIYGLVAGFIFNSGEVAPAS